MCGRAGANCQWTDVLLHFQPPLWMDRMDGDGPGPWDTDFEPTRNPAKKDKTTRQQEIQQPLSNHYLASTGNTLTQSSYQLLELCTHSTHSVCGPYTK